MTTMVLRGLTYVELSRVVYIEKPINTYIILDVLFDDFFPSTTQITLNTVAHKVNLNQQFVTFISQASGQFHSVVNL